MPDPRGRVVISGVGCVSPQGVGTDAFADACLGGVSGIKRYCLPANHGFGNGFSLATSAIGAVEPFDPAAVLGPVDARRVPRVVALALAASREALSSAKLLLPPDDLQARRHIGVILGTGGGGLAFVERQYVAMCNRGKQSPFAITAGTQGNLSGELSIALGLRGLSHVISTGCASSTDAIGYALTLIRAGVLPRILVGGADAPIAPGILKGFETMGVVSTRFYEDPRHASRPFDADRDGFVLGEGAWMFLLESADAADERGATPLAEVAGYASTCDAYHRVRIAPDAEEGVRAMTEALADARLCPADVDHVNLHGTGTDLNDRLETLAVRRLLGDRADDVPVNATKSMIGHPQGAGGAAGVAATILTAFARNRLHPTINLEHVDDACRLNHATTSTDSTDVRTVVCNCIAFGSKNSAIVLRRPR